MNHKTKKTEDSYSYDMLVLIKGDLTSKDVARIAKEKEFRGIIIWFSKKEALNQGIPLPRAYINGESYDPRFIIDAIKAYE